MKIFVKAGKVIGFCLSTEPQTDSSAYGDDVVVLEKPDDYVFGRVGDPLPEGIPDNRPLAVPDFVLNEAKEGAKNQVMDIIRKASDTFVSKYPISEMLSWPLKQDAARLQLAGGTLTDVQQAMLNAELAAVGGTMTALCNSIIANAQKFSQASGTLSGIRGAAYNDIDNANKVDGLPAIVKATGVKVTQFLASAST